MTRISDTFYNYFRFLLKKSGLLTFNWHERCCLLDAVLLKWHGSQKWFHGFFHLDFHASFFA